MANGSPSHETHGYYAQGVGPDTAIPAILPYGWLQRVHRVQNSNTNDRVGYCLAVADLFMPKAAAGGDRDREFCMALLEHGYLNPARVLELVPCMPMVNSEKRRLRASIRRWAKALRDAGHLVPEE